MDVIRPNETSGVPNGAGKEATAPRKEAIPISGPELVTLLLADLAKTLVNNNNLGECIAYPGAKVEFQLVISTVPLEEGRKVVVSHSKVLDFSNPPDVVRILSGLPVWHVAKVILDQYTMQVEVGVEPSAGLRDAALKVASGAAGAKLTANKPQGGR